MDDVSNLQIHTTLWALYIIIGNKDIWLATTLFVILQSLDPSLLFPNPTFSLGLTQEGRIVPPTSVNATAENEQDNGFDINVQPSAGDADNGVAFQGEAEIACRKSKRQKVPTKSLMGEYECDKAFLNRASKAVADAIYKGGNIDFPSKFGAVMEKLKSPWLVHIFVLDSYF